MDLLILDRRAKLKYQERTYHTETIFTARLHLQRSIRLLNLCPRQMIDSFTSISVV
jgi:hypothetical protein